jgi:exopolysaccharide biosynthesis protein
MEDSQALPVNPVVRQFKRIQEDKPVKEEQADTYREIVQLANDPRWHQIQEVIGMRIKSLEAMFNVEVTDTPEQVGFRYMALKTVIGELEWVKNLPETTYHELEKAREQRNGSGV